MIEKYVCPRDTMTNEILWNLTSWWIFRRTKNIAKLIKKIFSLLFLKKKYNLLYYITHFLSFYYYCTCDPFLFFVLLICRYLLILSLIYHWNCFEWIKINWIECNFLHLMNFFQYFYHSFFTLSSSLTLSLIFFAVLIYPMSALHLLIEDHT